MHDMLGFSEVCARWLPRELTKEHKRYRVEIYQSLLTCYSDEYVVFM